ncbi:MAG: thiamine pyrophosphate-binding protein [Anaerolineae bacterium]|nr:thiamine pyrophosphate-binding protein [Anaerolineae bacterium]
MNGGELVAEVLAAQGVPFLFTLVGGHISPILVAAKRRGIRVVDTRHEATAVFAADAVARLTGRPGVAAVTAGPGVTNTLTAVKNAQMAQSPVVLIGGAAPTALQGRGALQDIDQMSLFTSVVKWSRAVRRVKDLMPALEEAFRQAQSGVPGPVFVECPVDLLYDEGMVRRLYGAGRGGKSLGQRAVNAYLKWHVDRLFAGADQQQAGPAIRVSPPAPDPAKVRQVAERLRAAQRPLFVVGSQATLDVAHVAEVAAALERIAAPVYLSGMARGLLGRDHPLQMRHKRREALREADFVLLAGVPCDFRLDYGNHIRRSAVYVSVNRSREDLTKNRKPTVGVLGDPGLFLRALAAEFLQVPQSPHVPGEAAEKEGNLGSSGSSWPDWLAHLRQRDEARNEEIAAQAAQPLGKVNPLHLLRELDRQVGPQAVLVADGGDFVGSAAYIVQPPGPLTWLDPGPFGTLGVGAGFALGAKLCRPDAEVWILYGDGSAGYSLAEFDTFVRHGVPVIAVVGNDAGWSQIAREQVEIFGDDVATVLAHTDYHRVAEGFGGVGFRLDDPELAGEVLEAARQAAAAGRPALVNAILARSDFRKGSISM